MTSNVETTAKEPLQKEINEKEILELNLLDLPAALLMDVFELLPYDTVAKNRQVCRDFDDIGGRVLNAGFNKVIRRHSAASKSIKTQLPRRESERRSFLTYSNHYLARHSDVLSSIETRISMLSLTYGKYIDMNLCCFIPGRVLDEINRVLDMIGSTNRTLRPHEVLQELRDISSMAIEHFDEFIVINIKKTYTDNLKFNDNNNILNMENNSIPIRNELVNITQDTERFQDMESATKELYQRLVFGPNPRNKTITNKINSNNNTNNNINSSCSITEGGTNKAVPTFEDVLANIKKIEKTQNEMQQHLNKLLFTDKRKNRQLSDMCILTRDLSHKITLMQKRIKELEMKNRELHATIIRITECDDNDESFKSDKLKISTTGNTTSTTGTVALASTTSNCPYTNHSILNEPSCSPATLKSVLDQEIPSGSTLPSLLENLRNEAFESAHSLSDSDNDNECDVMPLQVLCGSKRTKADDNVESKELQSIKKYKI